MTDFTKKLEEIFKGTKSKPADAYEGVVSRRYEEFRSQQFNKAMGKVTEANQHIRPETLSIVGAVFNYRDLERVVSENHINKDSQMVQALVEYGRSKRMKSENIVENPRAMVYAINKVYGSLENYKQEILDGITKWHKRFSTLAGKSDLPCKVLSLLSETGVKSQSLDAIGGILEDAGNHASKIGKIGEQLVVEYSREMADEIKRYEALGK